MLDSISNSILSILFEKTAGFMLTSGNPHPLFAQNTYYRPVHPGLHHAVLTQCGDVFLRRDVELPGVKVSGHGDARDRPWRRPRVVRRFGHFPQTLCLPSTTNAMKSLFFPKTKNKTQSTKTRTVYESIYKQKSEIKVPIFCNSKNLCLDIC